MNVTVGAECLAAVLVLDPDLEPEPEPFRMQPTITLVVGFDEYIRFITQLPPNSHLLHYKTKELQRALQLHNEALLTKAFYVDVALAIGKELYYACRAGKFATGILHTFSSGATVDMPVATLATESYLIKLLKEHGYAAYSVSGLNKWRWQYACNLLQAAVNTPVLRVRKTQA